MNKIKIVCLLAMCAILGAAAGIISADLVVDNARIEFKNTRNSMYIGEGAGIDAYANGTGDQCHNIGIGEWNLESNECNSFGYTEGTRNVCVGNHACQYNTTGRRNVAFGVAALGTGQHNDSNIAMGYHALTLNGDNLFNNIAIGEFSQQRNAGNNRFNISFGMNTLEYVDGDNNISIGAQSGSNFTEGDNNFFLGVAAGRRQVSGSHNVFLGYDSYLGDPDGSYQMNLFGVLTSKNKIEGHLRMRRNAGLELSNRLGEVYRITVDDNGELVSRRVE